MLDILSGVLFVAGLVVAVRRIDQPVHRLLGCALVINLVAGLLSISQEGPPYVLRVSAVMLPALLLVGTGLQWVCGLVARARPDGACADGACADGARAGGARADGDRADGRWGTWLPACIIVPAMGINLWLYFGLESRNLAATRVMAYELRLLTREFDRSPHPVILVGDDVFARAASGPYPEEEHAASNPTFVSGPSTSLAAVFFLARGFDPWRPLEKTLAVMKRHHARFQDLQDPARPSPMVAVCNARNSKLVADIRSLAGSGAVRFVKDIRGRDLFAVVELR